MSGSVSYHSGKAAEDRVAACYAGSGHVIEKQRWRGRGGEIDIVARRPDGLVFIEVKSSSTHARAAASLRPRQMQRIQCAAQEYCGQEPQGLLTAMQIDVALVDGAGHIEILENAGML